MYGSSALVLVYYSTFGGLLEFGYTRELKHGLFQHLAEQPCGPQDQHAGGRFPGLEFGDDGSLQSQGGYYFKDLTGPWKIIDSADTWTFCLITGFCTNII